MKDEVFYDQSGGGVTFSGGEPLMQLEFLEALLEECRRCEIHTAVDTTAYAEPEVIERIAQEGETDPPNHLTLRVFQDL